MLCNRPLSRKVGYIYPLIWVSGEGNCRQLLLLSLFPSWDISTIFGLVDRFVAPKENAARLGIEPEPIRV